LETCDPILLDDVLVLVDEDVELTRSNEGGICVAEYTFKNQPPPQNEPLSPLEMELHPVAVGEGNDDEGFSAQKQ
jgi:hypothetical protein